MTAERKSRLETLRYPVLGEMARRLPGRRGGDIVAVMSPGHLGDILHAVPMLKALRAGKPDVQIVWMVGPWSEQLARRYAGWVDEFRVFGPNLPAFTRGKREWCPSAWSQWRTMMLLRREGVDVLIASMDGVGRFAANALCPRLWTGIGDRCPPRVRAEIECVVQPYEKDRYEADAWCGLLKPLGIDAQAESLEYTATPEERAEAEHFLAAEQVDGARPLALMAPGSGWSGKNWLPERYGEVAAWLAETKGFQVAWVGTKGEEGLVPQGRKGDLQWMGRTPLPLLAAVMERARLFVGNDGGLLHLAAAQGMESVSIWGPTHPGKWGPKGARHRQVRKVERCEGCIYWDYREKCRHDHACMKAVAVPDVMAAIEAVLKA